MQTTIYIMKYLILFFLIAALAASGAANAATIYGTVYDLSLSKVTNSEVEINSSTRQMMVAKNGTYSFEVQNGFYVISSKQFQKNSIVSASKDNITVKQEGSYVIDLILFPELSGGFSEADPIEINESFLDTSKSKNYSWIPIVGVLAIMFLAVFYYFFAKSRKIKIAKHESPKENFGKEENSNAGGLNKLINIIKQEGGRATQKDIRKQIPLSEAKISLMITELEHKGVVEKIKKGRGNVIILKRE